MLYAVRLFLGAALLGVVCGCAIDASGGFRSDSGVYHDETRDGGSIDASVSADATGETFLDGGADRRHPAPCTERYKNPADAVLLDDGWLNEFTYDDDDRLIEQIHTTTQTQVSDRFAFLYDEEGRRAELVIDYRNDALPEFRILYTYDEADRVVRERMLTFVGGLEENRIHEYNEAGQLVRITWVGFDDTVVSIETYTPGPHGPLERRVETPPGTFDEHTRWTYDGAGRETVREELTATGDTVYRATFEYDAMGKLLRAMTGYLAGPPRSAVHTYHYDVHGNLLRVDIDASGDGSIEQRYSYSYDCFLD